MLSVKYSNKNMSEQTAHTGNIDPSLIAPNPTRIELGERVESVVGYFNTEFGLDIDTHGVLNTEPSQEQLSALKEWHESTSGDSIIMPDFDTFTAKMILAKALMPQIDEQGQVQYLFGKGAGAELALQGEVAGRVKRLEAVPYRTHSDFEIYAAETDSYSAIKHSERFTAVFGAQEIYPVGKTKGLSGLPKDLLHETAETVDFGGVSFLVPSLELQFVDKFEKANESVERRLREKTDAEWLASSYELDTELVHSTIDAYVIAPELAKLQPPEEETLRTHDLLVRKVAEAKRRIKGDNPQASDTDVNSALAGDFMLTNLARNKGIENVGELIDTSTGGLKEDITSVLVSLEQTRQAKIVEALQAKHQAVDETLKQSA